MAKNVEPKETKPKKGFFGRIAEKVKETFKEDEDRPTTENVDDDMAVQSSTKTAQQSSSRKKGEGLEAFHVRIREKAAKAKAGAGKSQFQ